MFELFTVPAESSTQRSPVGPGSASTLAAPSSSAPEFVPTAASSKISSIVRGVSPAVPLDPNSPRTSWFGIDVVTEGAAKELVSAVKRPLAASIAAAVAAPRYESTPPAVSTGCGGLDRRDRPPVRRLAERRARPLVCVAPGERPALRRDDLGGSRHADRERGDQDVARPTARGPGESKRLRLRGGAHARPFEGRRRGRHDRGRRQGEGGGGAVEVRGLHEDLDPGPLVGRAQRVPLAPRFGDLRADESVRGAAQPGVRKGDGLRPGPVPAEG